MFQYLNPGARIEPTFSYTSWDAVFAEIARTAAAERLVVVLDEFTYVMQADSEVPSLIQRAWDHQLQSSNVFLILTGSLAGIIQRTATRLPVTPLRPGHGPVKTATFILRRADRYAAPV